MKSVVPACLRRTQTGFVPASAPLVAKPGRSHSTDAGTVTLPPPPADRLAIS
ncbi:hypothetical protein HMPREF9946_01583 [Acetobacteraceae bacterium AT-5844]|nr:hypothetical protein HMPREF9946_01583 [Acetobacteraceae bacterium AT-5844]